jgi:hypothetical protein
MHLYLEESFLIEFERDFNNVNPSTGQKCLYKIFSEYTGVNLILDELQTFKNLDSRCLKLFLGQNPSLKEIGDFDLYFDEINELPNQSIVLCAAPKSIKDKIELLGGLYLDYTNYEAEIIKIIETTHFKFSFADKETTFSWSYFSMINVVPMKTIVIDDPYVLMEESLIKNNLIPLLQNFLTGQKIKPALIILTDKIQHNRERGKTEKETVITKYSILMEEFNSQISSLCIAKNKVYQEILEQHDRFLYTPFTICSIGKGFSIFPLKHSTSRIEQNSIFDKFSYNELKNHNLGLKDKYDKLSKLDVIESNLKIYPSSEFLKFFID